MDKIAFDLICIGTLSALLNLKGIKFTCQWARLAKLPPELVIDGLRVCKHNNWPIDA